MSIIAKRNEEIPQHYQAILSTTLFEFPELIEVKVDELSIENIQSMMIYLDLCIDKCIKLNEFILKKFVPLED